MTKKLDSRNWMQSTSKFKREKGRLGSKALDRQFAIRCHKSMDLSNRFLSDYSDYRIMNPKPAIERSTTNSPVFQI